MEPKTILELKMLTGVSTSYTNLWWANALKRSIHDNDEGVPNFTLEVLTEKDIEVDTVRSKEGRYISYPTFREGKTIPKDGLYHLNVQGSNYMFVGWLEIGNEGREAAWWGQVGSDDVMTGVAGQGTPLMNNHFPEINDWHFAHHYLDSFPRNTTLAEILKKF